MVKIRGGGEEMTTEFSELEERYENNRTEVTLICMQI